MELLPIYCSEVCPLGKKCKCCFGEVYAETLGSTPLRERHKCKYHKQTGKTYVETKVDIPAA